MLFLTQATLLHVQVSPNDTNKVKDHILSKNKTYKIAKISLNGLSNKCYDLKDFICIFIFTYIFVFYIFYI